MCCSSSFTSHIIVSTDPVVTPHALASWLTPNCNGIPVSKLDQSTSITFRTASVNMWRFSSNRGGVSTLVLELECIFRLSQMRNHRYWCELSRCALHKSPISSSSALHQSSWTACFGSLSIESCHWLLAACYWIDWRSLNCILSCSLWLMGPHLVPSGYRFNIRNGKIIFHALGIVCELRCEATALQYFNRIVHHIRITPNGMLLRWSLVSLRSKYFE